MTSKKRKKFLKTPEPDAPKKLGNPVDANVGKNLFLRFRFDRLDVESRWCLSNLEKVDHQKFLKKLGDFERMKVSEIFRYGNQLGKAYPTDILEKSAQDRLMELKIEDCDEIHRLRFSGPERLYGFLIQNEFSILWWDPIHEIVPSPLRNT